MPGAVFLEGDKVNLRTVEEEDLEFTRDNINDQDIWNYLTLRKPKNFRQQEEFFEEGVSSDENVTLAICVEEEIIGIVSLEDVEQDVRTADIGIWISTDHHGNGYGTEAAEIITNYGFNELNYHRIYARANEDNIGSQKIWKKLGFQEDGVLREQTFNEGEFKDIHIYGILEHEWRSQ